MTEKTYDHKHEPGAYGVCRRCGEEHHPNPGEQPEKQTSVSDTHPGDELIAVMEDAVEKLKDAPKAECKYVDEPPSVKGTQSND